MSIAKVRELWRRQQMPGNLMIIRVTGLPMNADVEYHSILSSQIKLQRKIDEDYLDESVPLITTQSTSAECGGWIKEFNRGSKKIIAANLINEHSLQKLNL